MNCVLTYNIGFFFYKDEKVINFQKYDIKIKYYIDIIYN